MIGTKIRVLADLGVQYIKDLAGAQIMPPFRGRPEITPGMSAGGQRELAAMCPAGAITAQPLSLDMGRCLFCGQCARRAAGHIAFTSDHRMAAFRREDLIIRAGEPFAGDATGKVRPEIASYFGHALKLRQVCAGGDNSTEMELNAAGNVNFDLGRYGIEFTASPRHSDGIVLTGPITAAMAVPLQMCWDAVPEPKILIAAGTDAISGGLMAGSRALDRVFLDRHTPDMWLPGNPVHPLTFVDGVLKLTGRKADR